MTSVIWIGLCAFLVLNNVLYCVGNLVKDYDPAPSPLPFPACRADNVDCLRRGLRTFFILMDSRHFGMKRIDPIIINSVAITMPAEQMSFLLRRVNVTGAQWSKLVDKKINLDEGKSGAVFSSDLHATGEISMKVANRHDPYIAYVTMDIYGVESNITYPWSARRGVDQEYYIAIGQERIAVRNSRTPTFFLQPHTQDAYVIRDTLELKPSILDHFSNELTAALMHSVVDNFRLFSSKVPVRHYYEYYK